MGSPPWQPHVSTFVIRIWTDAMPNAPRWRGRIENLQTGQHAAFEDLARVLAFIRAAGAFPEGTAPTGERPAGPEPTST
jgi:hypothetical protein